MVFVRLNRGTDSGADRSAFPVYDERLDNLIKGGRISFAAGVRGEFLRSPLNPAALLTFDVLPADSQEAAAVSLPQHGVRFTW